MNDQDPKQDVKKFYDQIGWRKVSEGTYQNARYEDLRPVSRSYIHKCHLRVNRFLNSGGKYLLDAGSGPIQYPEYLTYSAGYQFRVCLDISIIALFEARDRIDVERGLFVVADVANLPFKKDVFEGIVSLHTLHHLPSGDYASAYRDLKRVLKKGGSAVIVNGWGESVLMNLFKKPIQLMERFSRRSSATDAQMDSSKEKINKKPKGTFVHKMNADTLKTMLGKDFPVSIIVWRSVSVRFLRAMIQPFLLGRFWLWILYGLEEMFPKYFGENGQYPLITFTK